MEFSDLVLNVIIGIVSGCISGYVVSLYFAKKEEESQWGKELSNDKQTMSRYITLVLWELDQLMDGSGKETADLRRLLQSPPLFRSFKQLDKIKPEHQMFTKKAYALFREIDQYLGFEVPNEAYEIPKIQYVKFRAGLLRAQWDILSINHEVLKHEDSQISKEDGSRQ